MEILTGDPSNESAWREAEKVHTELAEYIKKKGYPDSWNFILPQPLQKRTLETGGVLAGMADSVLSTSIELDCPAGSTPFGGKILRYLQFFTPSKEKMAEGKRPVYQVLVQEKINNQTRFTLKKGSEVDDAAIDAYLRMPDKLKIGEYYSTKNFGVKYLKSYFRKL